ncbi:hypothetical protein [Sphingorhabdus sp.]|uniref:hypothetical protein n=1 Tax=Sphingorhabdus sp. TaxID=1902408 RepID=UPI002FDA3741
MLIPVNVRSEPGIKRDGTKFEGNFYVDGQWVRFQRGLPRKIGGYRQISNFALGIVRQFHTQALNGFVYTHMGYGAGIQSMTIDSLGNTSAPADRTPLGFSGGDGYMWSLDAMNDGAGGGAVIIGVATDTANDISNGDAKTIYIGNIYATSQLTAIPTVSASGGVCVLHPYLFLYGTNGFIQWSDINDPTNFASGDAGNAFISSSKIVKGLPLRGGGQNPAGLFWTLDSLIRAYYTGGTDVFAFDTISSSTSIIAANSVIEYDGIYFWVGDGRFMMYNGVVREVPNNMNINYFFDGLNQQFANKIFAYKVPRFGEIWWCYPRGDATECTHAVIFNFRENTWYDTQLPNDGRSAGLYSGSLNDPILAGIEPINPGAPDIRITQASPVDIRITQNNDIRVLSEPPLFKIWRHEFGVDEIDGAQVNAVESFFETGDISLIISDSPKNRAIHVEMMEPDFVQSGEMTVQITGRINARAPEVNGPLRAFPAVASEKYEQQVFFKEQRRELRFRFASNTVGGNYQMGQIVVHIAPSDGRYQS